MTYYFQFILKVKVRNVDFDPYCAGLLHKLLYAQSFHLLITLIFSITTTNVKPSQPAILGTIIYQATMVPD